MTHLSANSSKKSQKTKLFCNKKIQFQTNLIDFHGVDRKNLIDYAKEKGLEKIPKTHKITRWLYITLLDQLKYTDTIYFKQTSLIDLIEKKNNACVNRKSLTRANKELDKLNLVMVHRRGKMQSNMYFPNVELFIDDYRRSLEKPDITCDPLDVTFTTQYTNPKGLDKSNYCESNLLNEEKVVKAPPNIPIRIEEEGVLTSQLIEECKKRFSMDTHTVYEYFEQAVEFIKVLEQAEGKERKYRVFAWRKYFIGFCRKERALKQERMDRYIPSFKRIKYRLNLGNTPLSANQTTINMVQCSEVSDIFSRGVSPVVTVDQLTRIPTPEVVEKDLSFRGRYGDFEGIRDLNDPTDHRNVNYKAARTEEEQQEMDDLLAKYYPQLAGITKKE